MPTLSEEYHALPRDHGGGWSAIPSKDRPITLRQRFVLGFIVSFISERGRPPCLREISDTLGIKSTNGCSDALERLEQKGAIVRERHGNIRIPGVRWQMVRIEEGAKDDEQRRLDEEGAGGDR